LVTVITACRLEGAVLFETVYAIVPLLEPDPPLVIVSHDWLLEAVHAIVDSIVAVNDPPPATTLFVVGVTLGAPGGGGGATPF
jgi:hypothetical protein